jgi:hypothetical protein
MGSVGEAEKTLNLRVKQGLFAAMREHLLASDGDNESFCFLYAFKAEGKHSVTFIPYILVPIEKEHFTAKRQAFLQLRLDVMRKVYHDFIHSEGYTCLISCHSHPFDSSPCPWFSGTDDENDRTQASWFYNTLAKAEEVPKERQGDLEYLHLVMGQRGLNVRRYNVETKTFEYFDQVRAFFENKPQYFFPKREHEGTKKTALVAMASMTGPTGPSGQD